MISINRRKIGVSILLSLITLGIYRIYWLYLLVKNVRELKHDYSKCIGEMLCLVLIPLYSHFWWYTKGNDVKRLMAERGCDTPSGGLLYLALSVVGLDLVGMAILQNDFNRLAAAISPSIRMRPAGSLGRQTWKERIPAFASIIGLGVLIAAYYIIGAIKEANVSYGLKVILDQSVVVALVATGAVFIYTLGSFDISLGAATGVSALLGGMVYNATGSLLLMFLTCVGTAVVIGLLNSSLASVFNLPIFVTTVAMMSVLSAFMLILIGWNGAGDTIKVKPRAVRPLDNIPFKVAILVAYIAMCWFVFTFLSTGREAKFIGGNSICAKLSGISEKKLAIIASVISAVGVGLGAFLTIVYAPTLNKDTASSIGMDVIIAIVFGGMPVSGGPRSRILSAVVGAFSMGFLSQIMTMLNLGSGYGQMIKAGIFLLVVFIALGSKRGKLLTR